MSLPQGAGCSSLKNRGSRSGSQRGDYVFPLPDILRVMFQSLKYGDAQSTSNDGTRGQPRKEAWRVWACVLTVSPSPCCITISLSSKFKKFSERYSLVSAVCKELRGRARWWYRGKPPSLWSSLGTAMPSAQYSESHRKQWLGQHRGTAAKESALSPASRKRSSCCRNPSKFLLLSEQ